MRSKTKTLVFSLIPVLVLLLIGEIGFSLYYYHKQTIYPLAWLELIEHAQDRVMRRKAEKIIRLTITPQEEQQMARLLYHDVDGKKLRVQLETQYEEYFQKLVAETQKSNIKLILLYVPLPRVRPLTVGAKDFTDFIYQLAKKYHVELIDPTSEFMRFSPEDTSLLPDDDHMSRFGNLLLARSVFETLKKYTAHRTYISYEKRPRLFGDLEPNLNKIITHLPALTYALVTNAQGIRVDHPVTFPKQRQRILILGDSFTYGPYLPTTHTFPAQLDRLLPQQEVLSAGVFGYTISDEVELFLERAKYTEPDIVILQVMHNDILGLISYMENIFDRKQRTYSPSALEQKLLTKVRTNSDPI